MPHCLYNKPIQVFIQSEPNAILGEISSNFHGTALTTTLDAWIGEISLMQDCLKEHKEGRIIFEYDIPRLGKRIDVVVLLRGIIFCTEFKVGETKLLQNDIEQV